MLIKLSELYTNDWPDALSPRSFVLYMYDKVATNKLYNCLQYPFYQERRETGPDPYIPISERRPSSKNNICKEVVDDSTSLLFSEGHFPKIHSDDKDTRNALRLISKNCKLNEVMMEAALYGAIGSVAIQVGIVKGQLFYLPMKTIFLTPEFDNEKTKNLISVTEKKQVSGYDLAADGYPIKKDDLEETFWFMRVWGANQETYYKPWTDTQEAKANFKLIIDKDRTVTHNLGYVPIVWIRNLPGGDLVDGLCTFEGSIDIMIDRDYLLSQSGRGLRYSADPTLLIKAANSLVGDDTIVKSADRALVIGEDGDAKLLEITGAAAAAVDKHIRTLRESGLEAMHGNRADVDKLSVAQSGKAMEMMNQNLVWLADKLRISYGEGGLVDVLDMTLKLLDGENIKLKGKMLPKIKRNAEITLVWPPWYSYTPDDLQKMAIALSTMVKSGLISRETAIRELAHEFDIDDVAEEMRKIDLEGFFQQQDQSGNGMTPGESSDKPVKEIA